MEEEEDVFEEYYSSDDDDGSSDGDGHSYGKADYWNDRYRSDQEPFDWLLRYVHFQEHKLLKHVPKDAHILMVGCGNADLSHDMYADGYHNITNIDLSDIVIDQMKTMWREDEGMKWLVMDATQMTFDDASFDLVIDKSTLDCLFCCPDSFKVSHAMVKECHRVLKPGGSHICVSLHDRPKVIPFLSGTRSEPLNWKVMPRSIPNPAYTGPESGRAPYYSVFTCTKPMATFKSSDGDESKDDN